jgi:hypothetical protein
MVAADARPGYDASAASTKDTAVQREAPSRLPGSGCRRKAGCPGLGRRRRLRAAGLIVPVVAISKLAALSAGAAIVHRRVLAREDNQSTR